MPTSAQPNVSKQRVIDRYVVGYGTEYEFKLSVIPQLLPNNSPDVRVYVNNIEIFSIASQVNGYGFMTISGELYVELESYLTELFTRTQNYPPVVEIHTYSHDGLKDSASGYFEIPQQLDANPNQLEVGEISGSNLFAHFTSIIQNQQDFSGVAFGGPNTYRDTAKNASLGTSILQNTAPVLKSMLVSSSDELDLIQSIRFSQDEYTKFKNKYLKIAQQLINRKFSPLQTHNNTIAIGAWVDEILSTINIAKEYSSAFAYSYMIASGPSTFTESGIIPTTKSLTLSKYIDLNDIKNSIYVYNTTSADRLLLIDVDYTLVSTNNTITINFPTSALAGDKLHVAFFKSPIPAYIPATPSKLGTYGVHIPRLILDTSYVVPVEVIIGHDGSRTVAYGDYRDQLLLELEKRIYNLINAKFRNEYDLSLRLEDVKSGYFRQTRYSYSEFLSVTSSYINRWCAKNKANYYLNDWATLSIDPSISVNDIWKLYNYTNAVKTNGTPLNMPGNWKGIFEYMYDTYTPNTTPWAMLGFSDMPSWWVAQYGSNWSSTNTALWLDLEAGIIRQGVTAVYDVNTLVPLAQAKWARPGLSTLMPVDASGNLRSVIDILDVATSGNIYTPFDGFDDAWAYGDGSPVEQAWKCTSEYKFSIQEFLFLMKPGMFGESMWDTLGTEVSPAAVFTLPGIAGPVKSSTNYQYVQNDIYGNDEVLGTWTRPKNSTQYVHGENLNGIVQVRAGYQQWISDRLFFLGLDPGVKFGQKVRTLDVSLANKLAGFTNKDTTTVYMDSLAPNAVTTSLAVPSTNFEVSLYTGQPIASYSYSGVIIRLLADGKFAVYGYDLANASFKVLARSNAKLINVSVGGTPASYSTYTPGATYKLGDIVKYNSVYYSSLGDFVAGVFQSSSWQKLNALPVVGGVSVTHRPESLNELYTVAYGAVLDNIQEVFDLLIGWGAYLETQGWEFSEVSSDTGQLSDWLYSAKQFLMWVNTNWADDSTIQLSPMANLAKLVVATGYPDNITNISDGAYSILNKYGVAITLANVDIEREGKSISVVPTALAAGGIFFLKVTASQTEHVLLFDNETSFSDTIYDPLLRVRQARLKFNGSRSNGWYGKMEAPGYLIVDNQLVPNFDTIVDAMRYYYDPNTQIDNKSLQDLGRSLIGFEPKDYLTNLRMSDESQYLLYKGAIRQKGTINTFSKLFAAADISRNESLEVYEEWALRVGKFGNTVNEVSTEFILSPEKHAGNVIVARLNYIPAITGIVKEINILNAENVYAAVPRVLIDEPNYSPTGWVMFNPNLSYIRDSIVRFDTPGGDPIYYTNSDTVNPGDTAPDVNSTWKILFSTRRAKAYAVLNSKGIISRIDVSDHGAGYVSAPHISLETGSEPHHLDRLVSVWQGDIINDTVIDNVIDIDIDDASTWVNRPIDPTHSLKFPTTDKVVYELPTAGFVNSSDVNWMSYDVMQTYANWGSTALNPTATDTVWIANNFASDWDVYKLCPLHTTDVVAPWKVIANDAGNLSLLLDISLSLTDEMSAHSLNRTDFGNTICVQAKAGGIISSNHVFMFVNDGIYTDTTTGISYNSYSLLDATGVPVSRNNIDYNGFTDLLVFKSMRWYSLPTEPMLPTYVGLGDLIWVDNSAGAWAVFKIDAPFGYWDKTVWDIKIPEFWSISSREMIPPPANQIYGWDTMGPINFVPYRVQTSLIDTSLFESAEIFDSATQDELVLLPVYDPYKGIIPAAAKQNITYITAQDPARYNVTGNVSLLSSNVMFSEKQVGMLWWDTSTIAYMYYEQPMALDGTETTSQNLTYIRDNWGQLFPGSKVSVYEWVQSPVPPSKYSGSGTPRSLTDYVQVSSSARFTNTTETYYYFWVSGKTDLPNKVNRTLTSTSVANLLDNPRSEGFSFFAPIQQTASNNSYMFYNVLNMLEYRGNHIQVHYNLSKETDKSHAQWEFFREGDVRSTITPQFWDKMVDSLCGVTDILPLSDVWVNGLLIGDYLPWDVYGFDVSPWDNATETSTAVYGDILTVPDPVLSAAEKYGINRRPLQSMFVNMYSARQIFVESANNILKNIPLKGGVISLSPTDMAGYSEFWNYVTWYATGYDGVKPIAAYYTLADANEDLLAGKLATNSIIEVINGTSDGRFVLYAVIQSATNSSTQNFKQVGMESSSIVLSDALFTSTNSYRVSKVLRNILKVLKASVFVDAYIVNRNLLFFSMLNYVMSEQRTPDWVFKSSYIYIKENNIHLTASTSYVPDQSDNIKRYIQDNKPYHTEVRDYTSVYSTTDIARGVMSDIFKMNVNMVFTPAIGGVYLPSKWGTNYEDSSLLYGWDQSSWDVQPENYDHILNAGKFDDLMTQAQSGVLSSNVVVSTFDIAKRGLSRLWPYTFSLTPITLNNPQTITVPPEVINISVNNVPFVYGEEYFVGVNADNTYTVYFYNPLDSNANIIATINWTAGKIAGFRYGTNNTEVAHGFPKDNLIMIVDTKLPVNMVGDVPYPLAAISGTDTLVSSIITAAGGVGTYDELLPVTIGYLPTKLSFTQHLSLHNSAYHRNSSEHAARIINNLTGSDEPGVGESDELVLYVAPESHPGGTDILPTPTSTTAGVVWVAGERIEYMGKQLVNANTWRLYMLRRGTQGTSKSAHPSNVLRGTPLNTHTVPNAAFVETANVFTLSETSTITNSPGGVWYSSTPQADFLRGSLGAAVL